MMRLLPPWDCSGLLVSADQNYEYDRVKGGYGALTSALELLVSVGQNHQ